MANKKRPPREYDSAIIFEAQDLYCVSRKTFSEVAKITGVSPSTLKRWADRYDWQKKKTEIAKAEMDIRANTVLARSTMLQKLLEDGTPQAAFAVTSLEQLALAQAKAAQESERLTQSKKPSAPMTPEEAINALETAVARALDQLLSNPEQLDLKRIKEIRESMIVISTMRQELSKEEAENTERGFSAETEAKIRAILGGA